MKNDSEILKIAISFRGARNKEGLTKFGAFMSEDMINEFKPDPVDISRSIVKLGELGFEVSSRGDYSLSVRGSKETFERIFGTTLKKFDFDSKIGPNVSAKSFLYPDEDASWNDENELSEFIDDAYIQWPHVYLNQRFPANGPSLYPPNVSYHHLRVPGDVVLTMNAAKVHREGITGKGVTVAMIDSGFNFSHPYFQENGYNTSVSLAPGANRAREDGNGHGTGESTNLLALAPGVNFVGIKLNNEDNPHLGASILEGFHEALSHNPKVISVSLGYDLVDRSSSNRSHLTRLPNSLKALEAEIQNATAKGIAIVFAAGNGHVSFPGMMPEVISAGGVFVGEDGAMQASDYASAFRSKIYKGRNVPDFCGLVGLAANSADYIMLPIQPKCEIDVRNSSHDETANNDGWGVFSGTSAAAPQLAGVCALLLNKDPNLSPRDLKSILKRTSRDVINGSANAASNEGTAMTANRGIDGATGTGLVDAFAAYLQV